MSLSYLPLQSPQSFLGRRDCSTQSLQSLQLQCSQMYDRLCQGDQPGQIQDIHQLCQCEGGIFVCFNICPTLCDVYVDCRVRVPFIIFPSNL